MKNKRNTYILLVLVLVVWGMIGYRIFSSLGSDNNAVQTKNVTVNFKPKAIKDQDTFSIGNYSRDPFLGTFKIKPKPVKKRQISAVKKEIQWPAVRYSGLIGAVNSDQQIYFVFVDNVQYLMKLKDEMNGVKLLKASKERITVSFQKQQKTITIDQ
ncbi:hypothetical protein GTQ40_13695 [Flavobacteriaceae bacterium R38]|nr:hypothetical protein [Flavobacteriaceae bacterium R38]